MSKENNGEKLIEKLHILIERKKQVDRISWDNMGHFIGYTGVGLKKALKMRSLSLTKLEEMIVKLGLVKEATSLGLKVSNDKKYNLENSNENSVWLNTNVLKNDKDIMKLESLCLSNWDSLMKKQNFKNKVELTAMKNINKILDERLAVILKNLKQ